MAALAGASCGQGFSRDAAIERFGDANPDATQDQAACVVDRLIDDYGLGQIESELAAEPLNPGFEETQFREMFRCGLEGDVEAQVVEQLAGSGVSDEDAPCVAEKLVQAMTDDDVDVLLSGLINDEFAAKFYLAIDECNISSPSSPGNSR